MGLLHAYCSSPEHDVGPCYGNIYIYMYVRRRPNHDTKHGHLQRRSFVSPGIVICSAPTSFCTRHALHKGSLPFTIFSYIANMSTAAFVITIRRRLLMPQFCGPTRRPRCRRAFEDKRTGEEISVNNFPSTILSSKWATLLRRHCTPVLVIQLITVCLYKR